MSDHFNKLTPAETERLAMLAEDIRFAILRRLWRLDGGSYYGLDGHTWLARNGWSVGFWVKAWVKEAA